MNILVKCFQKHSKIRKSNTQMNTKHLKTNLLQKTIARKTNE